MAETRCVYYLSVKSENGQAMVRLSTEFEDNPIDRAIDGWAEERLAEGNGESKIEITEDDIRENE